jgi:hypothetical protein
MAGFVVGISRERKVLKLVPASDALENDGEIKASD